MAKKSKKGPATNEKIFGLLLDVEERITDIDERMATKADIKKAVQSIEERMTTKADLRDYATKNDLERVKDEILDVFKPVVDAVDKDAQTVVDHGKRIVVLERKTGVIAR